MAGPVTRVGDWRLRRFLVGLVVSSVIVCACQGPATATSVEVAFANLTSEAAFVGWVAGDLNSPSIKDFYTLEPCSVNHFRFRAGTTSTIVVRSRGQSRSFVLVAPFVAGTREDTIRISDAGATYEPGATFSVAAPTCPIPSSAVNSPTR
jgi:hypothetical protein